MQQAEAAGESAEDVDRPEGAVAAAGTPTTTLLDDRSIDVTAMPRVLRRIAALAFEHPWLMGVAALAAMGAAVAGLVIPRYLGHAVDEAHALLAAGAGRAGEARRALLVTAGLVILAQTARGLLIMVYGYAAEYVGQSVAYKLRLKFFEQLQRLSFGFHDRIHSGDLITRGMLDLEGARAFIEAGMLRCFMLVTMLAVAAGMLMGRDLLLGAVALSFVPFAVWRLARMGFLLRVTWLRLQRLMSVLTRTMEENLQGIRVVRAFAAKAFELAKFDAASSAALKLANDRIFLRFRAVAVLNGAFYASMGLLLWIGGVRVIGGVMTIGQLTEYLVYMMMLQGPVRQVAMVVAASARATSSGGRLFEVLDLKPEIDDAPEARELDVRQGVIRFEHVDFAYGGGRKVLSDISFELRAGETLGLVGPPGSGKSTIAHLAPRFYDPTAGRVTIDGQDLRAVTLQSLRRAVSLIQQDTFLFDATVTNNIAYADPWAEDQRILEAASAAQIHEYVASLPGAYETRIGERGVSLSGGQRQRLSIARGIVPGPALFIFDDSTAAIDAVTERRVRAALGEHTKTAATMIIAHRLSSLMHANEILVLDEGRIIERGNHADLLALGGEYAALYALQSRAEADPFAARAEMSA